MATIREDFRTLIAAGEQCPLDRAALAIARIGHPDLDPSPYLARLDGYAETLESRGTRNSAPHRAALDAARYLFGELQFRGNRDDYYDPRNSFLNDVLERGMGIPITLSVVLLSVAARLGLPVHGVGFPGHFLVRIDAPEGPLILDPFAGGRTLERDELLQRLRDFAEAGGGQPGSNLQRVLAQSLQIARPVDILTRMLGNLLGIYLERNEDRTALTTVDLLALAAPDTAEPLRVRGLLYARLECFASALDDLRQHLTLAPDGPHAADVRARILELEGRETLH